MSSRARSARRLSAVIAAETGIDVEIRWDASAGSRGWRWHVVWSDGPSESAMRGHAERILHLRQYDLAVADLVYLRTVQPFSVALALVRNARLGQDPLGDHDSVPELEESLRATSYPEQGAEDDRLAAATLCQLTDYVTSAMPAVLARHGATGLRAGVDLPDNVVPLFREGAPDGRKNR